MNLEKLDKIEEALKCADKHCRTWDTDKVTIADALTLIGELKQGGRCVLNSDAVEIATWKYEELRKDSAVSYCMSEAIKAYFKHANPQAPKEQQA